jgi:lipopolysaccharide/colanic/teichoic acid biosynthesis glycosyltransferase
MAREQLGDVLVPDGMTVDQHLFASFIAMPVLLMLFWARGLYDREQIFVGTREYAQVAHALTYGILLALGASYFVGNSHLVSRAWLLLIWGLSIADVSLGRFVARRVVRQLRRRGFLRTRVVVVGASSFGLTIAEQLSAAANEGLDVVGFLDEYIPPGQLLFADIAVIGRPADLLHEAGRRLADEFILIPQALPYERQEEISRLMASRPAPTLRMAVSSSDLLTHGVRVVERGNVALVTVAQARLQGFESLWKRTFDIVGAACGLLMLAPMLSFVLARAWLANRRPLVRCYPIDGVAGARSSLWLLDRSVANGPLLRGAPALLAVLTGELSLVGPRPRLAGAREPGGQADALTAVKPGLTGRWRLSGPDAPRIEQAVQDLSYVRNYSIWEDVRIAWQSLRRLHAGRLPGLLGRWDDDVL